MANGPSFAGFFEDFGGLHQEIVADRVRNTAKGFWEKMQFDGENNRVA
jgi:hypothetical protein